MPEHGHRWPDGLMKDPFIKLGVMKDPIVASGLMKDPFITAGAAWRP
jgi:hypothetical protein